MPEITDANFIRSVLEMRNTADDGDFIYELHNVCPGSVLNDLNDVAEVPVDWIFKVVEVEDEKEYDSYGNSHTDSAYVILSVVAPGKDEVLYRIPGEYSSYEGWNWYLNKLTHVEKRERIIKSWDWVSV